MGLSLFQSLGSVVALPSLQCFFPLPQHYSSFIFELEPMPLGSYCFYFFALSLINTYTSVYMFFYIMLICPYELLL